MAAIEQIEKEIQSLTAAELACLREWFDHYCAEQWDARIAADAASGKLAMQAERALAEHHAHGTRGL